MRTHAVVFVIVALSGSAVARAQNPLDDVYNWREPKTVADPTAAKKWPPYYKPAPMLLEHQAKYANGWCTVRTAANFRSTPTYTIDPDDIIDVNKLPETSFTGKIVGNRPGQMLVRNEAKEECVVIIHPDSQLSSVAVLGEALPEALKSGMFVRFSGKINQQGEAREVEGLELVMAPQEAQTTKIRVDERQAILARVASCKGDLLTLRIKSDSHSRLTVKLSEAERIALRGNDNMLGAEGDEISVKGRLYRPDTDRPAGDEIFAAEVKINLAKPVVNVTKARRKS